MVEWELGDRKIKYGNRIDAVLWREGVRCSTSSTAAFPFRYEFSTKKLFPVDVYVRMRVNAESMDIFICISTVRQFPLSPHNFAIAVPNRLSGEVSGDSRGIITHTIDRRGIFLASPMCSSALVPDHALSITSVVFLSY